MMILSPSLKGTTPPARELHLCRQQQRSAVVGSCVVLTKEADAFQRTITVSSGRVSEHASQNVVVATHAAAEQQNDVRGCTPVHAYNEVLNPAKTVRWSHLHSRLLATLKQSPDLLPRGSRALVAVSGGQDSMALLRLLVDLQRQGGKHKTAHWPLQLVVGHCDHNIREDSAQNAQFVQAQTVIMDRWLREWSRSNIYDSYMQSGQHLVQETFREPPQQSGHQSRAAAQPPAGCHDSQGQVIAAAAATDVAQQPRTLSDKDQGRTRHQQNKESDKAEQFVHQQADQLGLQYRFRTAPQPLKSEAAARSWRHEMLAEMATELGCSHILLGHTATDRAETLMFNLVRGAGPSGLCSMGWDRCMTDNSKLRLVRPLLNFDREETAEVCRMTGTPVYPDSTNSDDQYSRNLLRLRVFPHLAAINSAVVRHMAQTCELLQADSHLLDSLAQRHMQDALQNCMLLTVTAVPLQSAQAVEQRGQEGVIATPSRLTTAADGYDTAATGSNLGSPTGHSTAGIASTALHVERLRQIRHKALQYRVIHQWLQQQLSGAVHFNMVRDVHRLGVQAAGVSRTGTLRGRQCVVRRNWLLLCVDTLTADQLVAGKVRLTQVQEQSEVEGHLRQGELAGTLGLDSDVLERPNQVRQLKSADAFAKAHHVPLKTIEQQQEQQLHLQPAQSGSVVAAAVTVSSEMAISTTATTSSCSSRESTVCMHPRSSQSWQQSRHRWQEPVSGVSGCDSNFLPNPARRRRRKVTDQLPAREYCLSVG